MSTSRKITVFPALLNQQNLLQDEEHFDVIFDLDNTNKLQVLLKSRSNARREYIFSDVEMVSFYLIEIEPVWEYEQGKKVKKKTNRHYVMSLWYRDDKGGLQTIKNPWLNFSEQPVPVNDHTLCHPFYIGALLQIKDSDIPISVSMPNWKLRVEDNGNLVYWKHASNVVNTKANCFSMSTSQQNEYFVDTAGPGRIAGHYYI